VLGLSGESWATIGTVVAGLAFVTTMLSSRMKDGFAAVGERFDRMDRRMDRVDQRMDRIDERMDRIDQRFDRFEASVTERFDKVDEHVDRFEQSADERSDSMVTTTASLGAEVARLSERMDHVQATLNPIVEELLRAGIAGRRASA
jgi:methyl-accepting chemotaxis protein